MKDERLLQLLALNMRGKNARIKDLEEENTKLRQQLEYNIQALQKSDNKIIELQKKAEKNKLEKS